jgi:hypothetical protein
MKKGFGPRDDLIDKVQHGKLTPAQAETEAVRLGLGPFAACPDPDRFNPIAQAWWDLPMAVAWIAWRSIARVREYWDAYRHKCWDWHFHRWRVGVDSPVYEGHFLEQRRPATLLHLHLAEGYSSAGEEAQVMTVKEAEHALWQALEEGLLQATGISAQTGERTPIAAHEWRDLRYFEERQKDVVRLRKRGPLPSGGYEDLTFSRKGVMALWAEKLDKPEIRLHENVPPSGPGYMPLYCAAQWIATAGWARSFDPLDVAEWKPVYSDLLARLASEDIRVIGFREGMKESVPGYHFASCAVDYPFEDADFDLIVSDELHLRSHPYLDEEHWLRGFDDALVDRRGARWRRLMVLKSDVARFWSFGAAEPPRTGAPGRPTSMQLIERELETRAAQGALEQTLAEQARVLETWLKVRHPRHPRARTKTIENGIRKRFRDLKALEKNVPR